MPAHVLLTTEQLEELLSRAVQSAPRGTQQISSEQLSSVVSSGIQQAFVAIGISAQDPQAMQQDFAFLRSLRTGVSGIRSHGIKVLLGAIITGLCTILWLGAKALLKK